MIICNLKINTLVKQSQCATKTYSARVFLAVMSSGYKRWLGEKTSDVGFFTIEPQNCRLKMLFSHRSDDLLSSYFENVVTELLYDLVLYGRAFLLINPEYKIITNEEGKEYEELYSLDIGSISGVVKKQNDESIEFCALSKYDKTLHHTSLPKEQLITFDLKELGYRRDYFYRLIKVINKFDATSIPTDLNLCRGFNFIEHYKYINLKKLKRLKAVGWVDKTNDLLNSYRLYNQIRMNKIRIKLFDYVVRKINEGLSGYLKETNIGNLVSHTRSIDYDKCWIDYSNKIITPDQLHDLLY